MTNLLIGIPSWPRNGCSPDYSSDLPKENKQGNYESFRHHL